MGSIQIGARGTRRSQVAADQTTANTKIHEFQNAAGTTVASVDIEGDIACHDLTISGTLTPPLEWTNFASGLTVATDKAEITSAGAGTFASTVQSVGDFKVGATAGTFNVTAANGNTVANGTVNSVGDFKVGSSAGTFNVTASNGNVVANGTVQSTGNLIVGASSGTVRVTAASGNVAIDGTLGVAGAISGPCAIVSASSGTTNLTAAQSGALCINTGTSGTTTFALPAAAVGLRFTFLEAGDAGGELIITPATGDSIKAKATVDGAQVAPSAGVGIKNAAAGNTVSDSICLVATDENTWRMVSISGTWAAVS